MTKRLYGPQLHKRPPGRWYTEKRRRRLEAEPWCRDCAAKGKRTPATVPDHIQPLALGGTDLDSNIRCLCHDCHVDRTNEQFGNRMRRPRIAADGWPEE